MKLNLRGEALYKAVCDHIKQYIIENNLKPGDPLPSEGQLADDLGVGRGSVREAVKSLQSLGIVDVQHGTGLSVRELNFDPMLETFKFGMQFDARTIAELLQIRILLETAVIGSAVERIDASSLQDLDDLLVQWESYNRAGKPFTELDEDFHRILYSTLDNQSLMQLFDVFWDAFWELELGDVIAPDPDKELQTHRRILDAVKARDAELARSLLTQHFDFVSERIAQYRQASEQKNES
ncbi:MAG: FadR/GntR family transcriptional regulator [Chloroflexota bacterium]